MNSLLLLFIALIIVVVAFFIRASMGFGSALISIPLLTLLLEPKLVIPTEAILEVIISLVLLPSIIQSIDFRSLLPVMIGGLIGSAIGAYYLPVIPTSEYKRWLGISIIILAILIYYFRNIKSLPKNMHPLIGWIAGIFGGLLGGIFGQSGPPLTLYLASKIPSREVLRATLIGLFIGDYGWRVILFSMQGLINNQVIILSLFFLPGLALGSFLGARQFEKVTPSHFEKGMLILLLIAGTLNII